MIEKVTLKNHEANISGNCVSSAKMLEDKRKLALGPHINSRALKPMSRTSGLRYVSLVAPVLRLFCFAGGVVTFKSLSSFRGVVYE